jgi:hypothetical protein
MTEADLRRMFEGWGRVESITIKKGYAWLLMWDNAGAKRALEESTWTRPAGSETPLQVGRDERSLARRPRDARAELSGRVSERPSHFSAWLNGLNGWQRELLASDWKLWQRWLEKVGEAKA